MYYPFLPLTEYIPDVEPHVFGDRVYLIGSHDRANGDTYCQEDYEFYSAPLSDLTNWSSKGISYRAKQDPDYSEVKSSMYAPDCVQGNDGRYYLYYALAGKNGMGGYEGPFKVAVSDAPDGPYEYYGTVQNPDGTPYLRCIPFDPSVINDNGVVRMYYGAGYPFVNYNIPILNQIFLIVQSKLFGKSIKEIKKEELGINGAVMVTLDDDMITVSSKPRKITPNITKGTPWEEHPFFEASSIRKIKDTYYFIYSSQAGHELCYATSKYPNRDFQYRGVIISNGDIGYKGRKGIDRIAMTGNNHGSIECLNGQWYVFYHRQTNGTNFSRQACVEPIEIREDGSIPQVSVSSMGFHGKTLEPKGDFAAASACILTNGNIDRAGNPWNKFRVVPMITQTGNEVYIKGIKKNTRIGIRYFHFEDKEYGLSIKVRGSGDGRIELYEDEDCRSKIGGVTIAPSENWTVYETKVKPSKGKHTLMFLYKGKGVSEFLEFSFIERPKEKLGEIAHEENS